MDDVIVLAIGFWTIGGSIFYLLTTLPDTFFKTQRVLPLIMTVYLYSLILTGGLLIGIKDSILFTNLSQTINANTLFPFVIFFYFFIFVLLNGIKICEENKPYDNMYKHLKHVTYAWIFIPIICYFFNHNVAISLQIALLHTLSILMIIIAYGSILYENNKIVKQQ